VIHDGRIALVYRAVGSDGLSRFGLAWTTDGEHIEQRAELPLYEAALDTAETPLLHWETVPFRVRSGSPICVHPMNGLLTIRTKRTAPDCRGMVGCGFGGPAGGY